MKVLKAMSKQLLSDLETPVSVYLKLCACEEVSFLFESSENVETIGRYSIIAWDPLVSVSLSGNGTEVTSFGQTTLFPTDDFFPTARDILRKINCSDLPGLPFVGSFAGYIGYDAVRLIEKLPKAIPTELPPSAADKVEIIQVRSRAAEVFAKAEF